MSEWIIKDIPDSIEVDSEIPEKIIKVLCSRGYNTAEEIKKFLYPVLGNLHDPFLFQDMEKAADRIITAINRKEDILVFGDYDVDGITGTVILTQLITELGGKVSYYIPHRIKEGYGFSKIGVDYAKKINGQLIITVDCGITACGAVDYAKAQGVDVIICDHHGAEITTQALAILNPKLEKGYPFDELAGCGVAFKLICALMMKFKRPIDEAYRYLDLVALGTIADVAPLIDENRIIARFGLERLGESENLGLRQLIEVAGLTNRNLSSYHVGFMIGPRINAAGRIAEANKAIRLLRTDDPEEARMIAYELDRMNRDRQQIEKEILKQAVEKAEQEGIGDKVIVLAQKGWHEGVIGIVASRLTERYYRPTFLISIAKDRAKGSARGVSGFDVFSALTSSAGVLREFGGHRDAGGFSLNPDMIDQFRIKLEDFAETFPEDVYKPKLYIDSEIELREINRDILKYILKFEPTGVGNPNPIFLTHNAMIVGYPRIVGNDHLRFAVMQNNYSQQAIYFTQGSLISELEIGRSKVDLVFSIDQDQISVRPRPMLKVKELKIRDVEA